MSDDSPVMLSKADIMRGLQKIDAMAREESAVVDLSVYGGAALALVFDLRQATRDVDAVVRGSPDLLRRAAAKIAAEEGWPQEWLNDGVKGFVSAHEKMRLMHQFDAPAEGGLRIYTPAPEYLFAMKCMAMRPEGIDGSHDISDIMALAELVGVRDAESAFSIIEGFYPAGRIPAKVRFGVEEILEKLIVQRKQIEVADDANPTDANGDGSAPHEPPAG